MQPAAPAAARRGLLLPLMTSSSSAAPPARVGVYDLLPEIPPQEGTLATSGAVASLSIDDIQVHPALRVKYDGDSRFQELVLSVKHLGFLSSEPLTVLPNRDGAYFLVKGFRRIAAAEANNIRVLPCHILAQKDALEFANNETRLAFFLHGYFREGATTATNTIGFDVAVLNLLIAQNPQLRPRRLSERVVLDAVTCELTRHQYYLGVGPLVQQERVKKELRLHWSHVYAISRLHPKTIGFVQSLPNLNDLPWIIINTQSFRDAQSEQQIKFLQQCRTVVYGQKRAIIAWQGEVRAWRGELRLQELVNRAIAKGTAPEPPPRSQIVNAYDAYLKDPEPEHQIIEASEEENIKWRRKKKEARHAFLRGSQQQQRAAADEQVLLGF